MNERTIALCVLIILAGILCSASPAFSEQLNRNQSQLVFSSSLDDAQKLKANLKEILSELECTRLLESVEPGKLGEFLFNDNTNILSDLNLSPFSQSRYNYIPQVHIFEKGIYNLDDQISYLSLKIVASLGYFDPSLLKAVIFRLSAKDNNDYRVFQSNEAISIPEFYYRRLFSKLAGIRQCQLSKAAIDAAVGLGEEALPDLIMLLGDDNKLVKVSAALAVIRIRHADELDEIRLIAADGILDDSWVVQSISRDIIFELDPEASDSLVESVFEGVFK